MFMEGFMEERLIGWCRWGGFSWRRGRRVVGGIGRWPCREKPRATARKMYSLGSVGIGFVAL